MGDLFAEFAFGKSCTYCLSLAAQMCDVDCNQAVIKIPGQVLSESAHNSRSTEKPAPNFLHFDSGVETSEDGHITVIDGQPIDPERLYTVAVYQFLLAGGHSLS